MFIFSNQAKGICDFYSKSIVSMYTMAGKAGIEML